MNINPVIEARAELAAQRCVVLGKDRYTEQLLDAAASCIAELVYILDPKELAFELNSLTAGMITHDEAITTAHDVFEMFYDLKVSTKAVGRGETL